MSDGTEMLRHTKIILNNKSKHFLQVRNKVDAFWQLRAQGLVKSFDDITGFEPGAYITDVPA